MNSDIDELIGAWKNSPEPSIKTTSYFPVYVSLFRHLRNKKCTFIETGVLEGGSLFMWKKWLGPDSRVIGIDLNPEAKNGKTLMSHFYESAIKEVDGCIVPSQSMAALLSSSWSGLVSIIEDPVEIDAFAPKEFAGHPVTLLWFGHSSNIDFLINFLSASFNAGDHIRLIVLSNEAGLNHFANSNLVSPAKIECNLALWSLENMVEAAKIADMCIIPSDLSNPKKMGASSNRLITALTLGLPTAADNLPSYREFENYYCNLQSNGFREILAKPLQFNHIVNIAQTELSPRFRMEKIEQDWKSFLLDTTS